MTNEEAIELLQIDYELFPDDGEHYVVAIRALEKQIPKKLRIHTLAKGYEFNHCTACDDTVIVKLGFCHTCGQALDWED